jgi:threonine dehydratase
MTALPTIVDVVAAKKRLAGMAVRTPLLASPFLSDRLSARVFVKPESLQRTGSFKFRGAYNALSALAVDVRKKGVIAVSSGNHAQGVAEAARLFGVPATIVMPADAPGVKRSRTERSGARVVTYDRAAEDRDIVVKSVVEKVGGTFVHPFNDPLVIAGQGTVGVEIADDCTGLNVAPDIVIVPCSGGGLTAGVALTVTARFPRAAVYAAEPVGFDDYARSLKSGKPERNERLSGSICDALLAPEPGVIGFQMNKDRLAGALAATDREALYAVGFAFEELRLVLEPGGAVGLAALLSGRLDVKGKTIIVVLSGGNVDDATLTSALKAYRSGG